MRIIAKPLAGLANKLRVIESSVSLAKELQCPVEIIWVPDQQMVAHYRELFEPSDLFDVIEYDKYRYCRSSFTMKGYKKPLSRFINSCYGIDMGFNEADIKDYVRPGKWDIHLLAKGKKIYVDTCHDFFSFHYKFSWVQPIPPIADAISLFSDVMGHNRCVGLHIRRTDNISSIEQSPDYLFEEMIRKEIEQDGNVIFFLATDDPGVENHFIGLFGADRILVYFKRFGRNSVKAIQDAVTDWFLLSKCRKLYCSYFSSFSETAAVFSGTEIHILNKDMIADGLSE